MLIRFRFLNLILLIFISRLFHESLGTENTIRSPKSSFVPPSTKRKYVESDSSGETDAHVQTKVCKLSDSFKDCELPSSNLDTTNLSLRISECSTPTTSHSNVPAALSLDYSLNSSIENPRHSSPLVKDRDSLNDSDVQILDVKDQDKSIEVVYDKQIVTSNDSDEFIDSQDIKLMLTGNTQSLESSQMPEDLLPKQTRFSQSKTSDNLNKDIIQGSISATETEFACQKEIFTQPDVNPLVNLPIQNANKRTSSSSLMKNTKSSMNGHDRSKTEGNTTNPDFKQVDSQKKEKGLRLPIISTPEDIAYSEESESIFVRVGKEASKRIEEEKLLFAKYKKSQDNRDSSLESDKSPTRKDDDDPSSDVTPVNPTDHTPKLTPISAMKSDFKDTPLSSERPNIIYEGNIKNIKLSHSDFKRNSTPNTSQGASPNISHEVGSSINKSNTSNEEVSEIPQQIHNVSDNDTLPFQDDEIKEENLVLQRDLSFWKCTITNRLVIMNQMGEKFPVDFCSGIYKFQKSNSGSSSGSHKTRTSDISSIRSAQSTDYYGDKSSSSLDSTRRTSTISQAESRRMSLESVITVGSPPKIPIPVSSSSLSLSSSSSDKETFVVPRVPQLLFEQDRSNSEKNNVVNVGVQVDFPLDNIHPDVTKSPNSKPTSRSLRGRGRRGRGRGRARNILKHSSPSIIEENLESDLKEAIDEAKPSSTKKKKQTETKNSRVKEPNFAENDSFDSIHPDIRKLLIEYQSSLSEVDDEIFSDQSENSQLNERQVNEISKRIREAELEPKMLVFARFTDNSYYSAFLLNYDESNDRWDIIFNPDNYKTSVREVHVLPTDILPRGQHCLVRRHSSAQSDPGIVRGHVRSGEIHYHLIETDKGNCIKVPHSNILLLGSEADQLLQPRLSFRSLITSPGGSISLDNLVPGKRKRRTPGKVNKPDPNLDSTSAIDSDSKSSNLNSPSVKSKSTPSRRGRNKTIANLKEESDDDYGPITPKRSRGNLSSPKTPKTPKRGGGRTPRTQRKVNLLTSVIDETPNDENSEEASKETELQVNRLQRNESSTPFKKRGRNLG